MTSMVTKLFPDKVLPKVLMLDSDHCPGLSESDKLRPVMTRRQADLEKKKALEEQGLGLSDLFSEATESKLSRGVKSKSKTPRTVRPTGCPTGAPDTQPSDRQNREDH